MNVLADTRGSGVKLPESVDPPSLEYVHHHGYRSRLTLAGVEEPPPILTPGFTRVEDIPGEWMLVRTVAQHERRIVEGLNANGLGFFYPYDTIYAPQRRRVVHRPMFPGYIFATTAARDYLECPEMETRLLCRSSRFVKIPSQARFVGDIAKLGRVTEAGMETITSPIRVKGERVLVVGKHPLHGLTGIVQSWQPAGMNVFINVEVMNQAKGFNVPENCLVRW